MVVVVALGTALTPLALVSDAVAWLIVCRVERLKRLRLRVSAVIFTAFVFGIVTAGLRLGQRRASDAYMPGNHTHADIVVTLRVGPHLLPSFCELVRSLFVLAVCTVCFLSNAGCWIIRNPLSCLIVVGCGTGMLAIGSSG